MSAEVGRGHVSVVPQFTGFRRTVDSTMSAAGESGSKSFSRGFGKTGEQTGQQQGRGFKRAFDSAAGGTGAAASRKLQQEYASATRAMSSAKLREQDMLGRVRVAQTQLNEARGRYAADSSQVIRAEERLAQAQRGVEAQSEKVRDSLTRLNEAKKALGSGPAPASSWATGFAGVQRVVGTIGESIGGAFRATWGAVRDTGAFIGETLKSSVAIGAAAITATLGKSIAGGLGRLQNIENARAKMMGLVGDANEVARAMDIANDAALGTAFTFDDLANASAMAMTSGVKAGPELIKYLEAIKGAATAAGVSAGEVARIFGKVRTGGRAYTMEITQLADRQIPIWSALSEEIGVSVDEVRKLASAGQISADVFESATIRATGNLAAAMAETSETAQKNAVSAMNRFGIALIGAEVVGGQAIGGLQQILKPFYDSVKVGFNALGAAILPFTSAFADGVVGKLVPKLTQMSESFEKMSQSVKDGLNPLDGVAQRLSGLGPVIAAIGVGLSPLLSSLPFIGKMFSGLTGPVGLVLGLFTGMVTASEPLRNALAGVGEMFSQIFKDPSVSGGIGDLAQSFSGLMKSMGDGLGKAIKGLTPLLDKVIRSFAKFLPLLQPILEAVGALAGVIGDLLVRAFETLEPVLGPIVDALGNLFGTILTQAIEIIQNLEPFLKILTDVFFELFDALAPLLAPFIELVELALVPILNIIGFVIEKFAWLASVIAEILSPIIQALAQTLGGLIDFIVGVFTGDWTRAWDGIVNIFSGIFGGLAGIVTGIWDAILAILEGAVNGVIAIINGLIWTYNNTLGHAFGQLEYLEDVRFRGGPAGAGAGGGGAAGGMTFMADGGVVRKAGLSWVGEKGPELMYVPTGAQVFSNPASRALEMIATSSGGSGAPVANVWNYNNYANYGETQDESLRKFRDFAEGQGFDPER